ncbi:hypothetical protein ACFYT3_26360 [Nocardia amikacinitolerans]|uniref:hypothetical protein n=1 Tax=Nocardia amikacinitolerans TaxID=756689 RepID=UPI0020A4F5C2|nr:hypothetical protein [Nocardia amikacinitolerans]MCP2289702.1 hypothetical protein [Nocardia amikacinitolerans]
MTKDVVRRVAGVSAKVGVVGAAVGALVLGQHAVAHAAETTTFHLPLIKLSQTWGVPTVLNIYLTATVGEEPGVTSFGVANPGPFSGGTIFDSHARIHWSNLTTGAVGVVDVPDRETALRPCACAPAPVRVFTGAGSIVALATAGGVAINVSSGLGTFRAS